MFALSYACAIIRLILILLYYELVCWIFLYLLQVKSLHIFSYYSSADIQQLFCDIQQLLLKFQHGEILDLPLNLENEATGEQMYFQKQFQ